MESVADKPALITLRVIDDLPALYPTLEAWWTGHGFPPVPQRILPPLGVLASVKGVPTAAAWLYMDNGGTGVAMMEWIVAAPDARPRDVALAITHLCTFIKQQALKLDYAFILSTCRQPSLSSLLQRHGFQVTDSAMIHHLAVLDPNT